MKKLLVLLCLVLFLGKTFASLSQKDSTKTRYTIAVFVPLYLDSAFDAVDEYKYAKTFPKFINPGLEFYEGVQLAADSLNRTGAPLDIHILDTRSATTSIASFLQRPELSQPDLIIGYVSSNEVKLLADISRKKNIPFINANVPNDGGVKNNPSLVILNSTLRTHCTGIYKFLQRNYGTSDVVVFTRKGVQEDILKGYMMDIERSTASVSLKLKFVTLTNEVTRAQLVPHLDSNRVTICVAASLNEVFARNLTKQLALLNTTYSTKVMGMPTWDAIKEFDKKEYKGLEIFYSTPFYYSKSDKVSTGINTYFKNNLFSRPSDMVFRGYECLMHFGKLLLEHGTNIGSSIGVKKYKVFTDFDIQPVFLNKQSPTLDYFENKKLYFVKLVGGSIQGVY